MKRFHVWNHELHRLLGLFLSPFVLVFAVSTILLNHPPARNADAPAPSPGSPRSIEVPEGNGTVEQARGIVDQLGVRGEIDYIRYLPREERLSIPVLKPGEAVQVEVDLKSKLATVSRRPLGLAAALIYLHKMPGPHNVKIRGNWVFMRVWAILADATVGTLLFLMASGLYLWWRIEAERRAGWALLAASVVSASLLAAALCAG